MARHWLFLLQPLFGYSSPRKAYVMRAVGDRHGPVLRVDRRINRERNRLPWADRAWHELHGGLEGAERSERRWALWA